MRCSILFILNHEVFNSLYSNRFRQGCWWNYNLVSSPCVLNRLHASDIIICFNQRKEWTRPFQSLDQCVPITGPVSSNQWSGAFQSLDRCVPIMHWTSVFQTLDRCVPIMHLTGVFQSLDRCFPISDIGKWARSMVILKFKNSVQYHMAIAYLVILLGNYHQHYIMAHIWI